MKLTGQVHNVTPVQQTTTALSVALSVKLVQLGTVVILERRNVLVTSRDRTAVFVRQGGLVVGVIFIVIRTVLCGLVTRMEIKPALDNEQVSFFYRFILKCNE